MNIIDWHIKCDDKQKKCTVYEDKDEEFPVIEIEAKTTPYKDITLSNVEVKNIKKFKTLAISGQGKESIKSNKIVISSVDR